MIYCINDHLGTPMRMVAKNGATVWQADYRAFGQLTGETATIPNPLRFPGQYHDPETGLYHNAMRDYDPELGRYLQRDPIGLAGGLNVYGYAYQNSVNFSDPLGLFSMDPVFGFVYDVTGGWTPDQSTVDMVAGFGDGVSFGLSSYIRDLHDISGGVDKCSGAYVFGSRIGETISAVNVPLGRLAYALEAKSLYRYRLLPAHDMDIAKLMFEGRNSLKLKYRSVLRWPMVLLSKIPFKPFKGWGLKKWSEIGDKYKNRWRDIQNASTRTNNAYHLAAGGYGVYRLRSIGGRCSCE
ncbi:RHS repeat-associated core domain-containing protein [Hahella sp. SMD15-11]|uniref:RHS repeat-associated core domain-containing protein n=1 Tax=Thermohahella caldifontis TaxID=3142973 RepID=A0AB39UUX1_9GAMM